MISSCEICTKPGCYFLLHIDEILSDEDAVRWARTILEENVDTPRAILLARYIVHKP